MVAVSRSSGVAGTVGREAMREALDVGLESADGCTWVVLRLDVGDAGVEASIPPAASEILLRDLDGGATRERLERARLDAATR